MPLSNSIYAEIVAGVHGVANRKLDIPLRYQGECLQTFDGFENEVSAARQALAQNRGVYLFGPCGTGKTHLAIALLLECFANSLRANFDGRRPVARFISTIDLLLEFKGKYRTKTGESDILRSYAETHLLALDDLGAEHNSEWSRWIINSLVDRRYRDLTPTIFTSNLDLQGVAKAFDDRMASRIAGSCAVIKLDGPDRRVVHEPEQQSLAIGS